METEIDTRNTPVWMNSTTSKRLNCFLNTCEGEVGLPIHVSLFKLLIISS